MDTDQDGTEPAEWRSVLIDLSGVPLAELLDRDDSALARAVRRVTADAARGEPIAGFNSAL
ncbi:FxSxx-COOH cyclophane-containing RiPP peptide [Actinoplanes sp. G11-F43]|uniref:FxSxx-COOH cyclophane-containing RiPP peptide n=1 Tax=Actinoplanes sp. G11-F43 TaxID=3424130 RepID=UPI003D32996F